MPKQTDRFSILLIEDNPADLFLIEQMLLSSRFPISNIYTAQRISEAVTLLKERKINLVLLDLSLPDSFGMQTFLEIKDLSKEIPVIILTGDSDSEIAYELLQQNAQDYLVKGEFNTGSLIKSIEYSLERKKAEESLVVSEKKYKQVFYNSPFAMWIICALSDEVLEVNDAALKLYGYERSEFLSLTQSDICLGQMKDNKLGENLEKHRKKDGQEMIVEFTSYSINYYGKDASQVLVNDVTRKLKLEQQIRLQKQQMVEAVLRAQENERKAIGADLHDNINQILTALQLHLGLALDYPDKCIAILKKSISSVSLAIEEIRKLSKKLITSGDLKNLGLVHSLEALIADIQPLTKANLWLHAEGLDENGLTDELKTNIYRIIQEQLNNILKYADASCVDISLSMANRKVILSISDDGKGFDVMAPRKGIGISNIISRAELFNGSVKIDSEPGQGCRLHVELNVKNRWNEIECHGIREKN